MRQGQHDECWPWRTDKPGTFWWRDEDGTLHKLGSARLAYILTNGDVPSDRIVGHKCDNKACCNPQHLECITQQQNSLDMATRGLHPYMKSTIYQQTRGMGDHAGEKNSQSRLTNLDVQEIRRLHVETNMTLHEIGVLFSIRKQKVWAIVHRRAWAHVP